MYKNQFIYLIFIVCLFFISISVNFSKIKKHKLEYDEIYVLARANAQSIHFFKNPHINLNQIQPVKKIYEKLNFPKGQNLFENYLQHLKKSHLISNHPPLNDLIAKIFVYQQSDFIHMRFYSFASYIFLLLCFAFFLFNNRFQVCQILAILGLYSSISLISYQSIFPKSYSLITALFLLILTFLQKYLKQKSLVNSLLLCFLINLCFFTHFLTLLFIPVLIAVVIWHYKKPNQRFLENIFKYKKELLFLFLNILIYIPFVHAFTDKTLNHFLQKSYLYILDSFFNSQYILYTFNFQKNIALIFFLLIIFRISRKKNFIKKNLYLQIVLAISVSVLLLDLCLSTNVSFSVRFFLIVLPLWTIVIYQIFNFSKNNIMFIVFLSFTLFSNYNYHFQQKYSINALTNINISKAQKQELDLNKKTLIVINFFKPPEISFIHHLVMKSLNLHPLKIINQDQFTKIDSVYFVQKKVFQAIKEQKPKKLEEFDQIIET
jgi:hypothetical protein